MDKLNNSYMISQPFKFISNHNLIDLLKKSIPLLMGIFIFFNPFPHTTAIKEICYYLSVLFFAILILTKKIDIIFDTPLLLPFGLFVSWAFLTIFFAIDKENSIHDFYSHLIRYVILYYILINVFNSKKHLILLSWIIVISSTIFTLGGIIYFYFILGNPLSARLGVYSFVQIPVNVIGVISVFAIFLALYHFGNEKYLYHKIFLIFCFLSLFMGILLTQSRSNLIAVCVGGLFFFLKNKKRMVVFLSIIFVIAALSPIGNRFSPNYLGGYMNNRQVTTFLIAWEVIKDYPITGIGFGLQSYEKLNLKKYRAKVIQKKYRKGKLITDPHNVVLDIAVRLGILGLALSFYILFVFFKMGWDIVKFGKDNYLKSWAQCLVSAFVGVSTIGFFQPIFSHMPEVVFCMIFSMLTIIWRLNKGTTSRKVI